MTAPTTTTPTASSALTAVYAAIERVTEGTHAHNPSVASVLTGLADLVSALESPAIRHEANSKGEAARWWFEQTVMTPAGHQVVERPGAAPAMSGLDYLWAIPFWDNPGLHAFKGFGAA